MGSLERLEGLLGGLNLFKPTKGAVIEGMSMGLWVRICECGLDANQHPHTRLLFIICSNTSWYIPLKDYWLIIPRCYYIGEGLYLCRPFDYLWDYRVFLPLYGFFDFNWLLLFIIAVLLHYLDWLLAGLFRLSLYHLFVLHQSLSNQYILWLSLQSSKALLLIVILPDIP